MTEPYLIGLVGARGHTGRELIRLISGHPEMMLAYAVSREYAGRRVSEIAPEDKDECIFEALEPQEAARRFGEGHPVRDVAQERVVGGGLIGNNIGNDAALDKLPMDLGGIVEQCDGLCFFRSDRLIRQANCIVKVFGRDIHLLELQSAFDTPRIDLDENAVAVHRLRRRIPPDVDIALHSGRRAAAAVCSSLGLGAASAIRVGVR